MSHCGCADPSSSLGMGISVFLPFVMSKFPTKKDYCAKFGGKCFLVLLFFQRVLLIFDILLNNENFLLGTST